MTSSNKLNPLWGLILGALVFATPVRADQPSLTFSPSVLNTQTGEEVVASVVINTAGQGVSGAGAQITFEPYYLTAVRIEPSSIFADYPATIIDNAQGKITISGIASSPTDLFTGNSTFADIVFRPYREGTTKLSFTFVPGSTVDSNIAVQTGNGDILAEVNQLTFNISAGSGEVINDPSPSPSPLSGLVNTQNEIIKTIARTLGLSEMESQFAAARSGRGGVNDSIDPLAPLSSQTPITDPSTSQPKNPNVSMVKSLSPTTSIIIPLLILIIFILINILVWFLLARRKAKNEPKPTSEIVPPPTEPIIPPSPLETPPPLKPSL